MFYKILLKIAKGVVWCILLFGYPGLFVLMLIESMCIPLPSEVILPFSGYLVSIGKFTFLKAGLAGVLGDWVGAVLLYLIVRNKGRAVIEKYGRYVLISRHHLDKADVFFEKFGKTSVFFGRILPFVRTFIALPAGVTGVPFVPFCMLSLIGSALWCSALLYLGMVLGDNWRSIQPLFHKIDTPIIILALAGVAYWVWKNKN